MFSDVLGQGPLFYLVMSLVLLGLLTAFAFVSGMVRYIPNDRIGVVEKLWSPKGSVQLGLLALDGEAGFQPELLRGGFHFFPPFQYKVHMHPMVSVTQGKLGYVFARDGVDLPAGQTLADNARVSNFLDVRGFLKGGGQKGPQRKVLREGTHIINPALFVVMTEEATYSLTLDATESAYYDKMRDVLDQRSAFTPVVIKEVTGQHESDQLAVVTVMDGPALPKDELLAPDVGDAHNSFQEPELFLASGGRRGRQERVLVEGTYYINRLFATVEFIHKTIIPVGFVGVVVSYTGRKGADTSGTEYSHGELVETGCRGVWRDALMPGKYAFNTYAGKIELVPTTNFVLMWQHGSSGSNFDGNLREITLITKDAFEPQLPLSVVVHIDYRKAPMVVQRFGNVKQLVEQTLDPMVSSYFKNVSQTRTFIELIQSRSELQANAPIEGGAASSGDRHVLVIDRDNLRLYEIGNAYPQMDGSWNASGGAIFHLDSNDVRPTAQPGWTSADAAGLPVFPGLARYEEAARGPGGIRHAMRFTVSSSRAAYVPPASHWAPANPSTYSAPMGMRVRLKASYVIPASFSTETRALLTAMKTYGLIVADNGSDWFVSGAPDDRWNNDKLVSELAQVKGSNFEVVRMDGLVTAP